MIDKDYGRTKWNQRREDAGVKDAGKKWEDGDEHHWLARCIYNVISHTDLVFMNDYFCWKSGGDGDNGETLMYALSVFFETQEKRGKINDLIDYFTIDD